VSVCGRGTIILNAIGYPTWDYVPSRNRRTRSRFVIPAGPSFVVGSAHKDGYDAINKGMLASDKIGLRNLILTGKAFTVKG
jgi:hypothetical protein